MSGRIGSLSVLQTVSCTPCILSKIADIPAAFGQITVGDDDPEAIEPPENL
jgi:hypothetical protein